MITRPWKFSIYLLYHTWLLACHYGCAVVVKLSMSSLHIDPTSSSLWVANTCTLRPLCSCTFRCSGLLFSFWVFFCSTFLKINLPLAHQGGQHLFDMLSFELELNWSTHRLSAVSLFRLIVSLWILSFAGLDLYSLILFKCASEGRSVQSHQFTVLPPAKNSISFIHKSLKISLQLFYLIETWLHLAVFEEFTCLIGINCGKKWYFSPS